MSKICSICKTEKEENEFNFQNKNLNKKHKHCKECQKNIRRKSYLNNRDYYLQKDKISIKNRRLERRAFITKYKLNKSCTDCKIVYPHYVMDFDHLPKFKKEIHIASDGHKYSKEKLLEEFAKCELVCSNCHRIRTWKRKNGG